MHTIYSSIYILAPCTTRALTPVLRIRMWLDPYILVSRIRIQVAKNQPKSWIRYFTKRIRGSGSVSKWNRSPTLIETNEMTEIPDVLSWFYTHCPQEPRKGEAEGALHLPLQSSIHAAGKFKRSLHLRLNGLVSNFFSFIKNTFHATFWIVLFNF